MLFENKFAIYMDLIYNYDDVNMMRIIVNAIENQSRKSTNLYGISAVEVYFIRDCSRNERRR